MNFANHRFRGLKFFAAILVLSLLLCSAALARLYWYPIDVSSWKSSLNDGLQKLIPASIFQCDSVHLAWGGFWSPVAIVIETPNISISLEDAPAGIHYCALTAQRLKAGISLLGLLKGQIKPIRLFFDSPNLSIALIESNQPRSESLSESPVKIFETTIMQVLRTFEKTASNAFLTAFERFEATKGRLSIMPLLHQPHAWTFDWSALDMRHSGSETRLSCVVREGEEAARLHAVIDTSLEDLDETNDAATNIDVDFSGIDIQSWWARAGYAPESLPLTGVIHGRILAKTKKQGTQLQWSVNLLNGQWTGDPYDATQPALDVASASIIGQGTCGEAFQIETNLTTKGPQIAALAQIGPTGLTWNVQMHLKDLAVNNFSRYWPAKLGVKARRWVLRNLSEGHVSHADLVMSGNFLGQDHNRDASGQRGAFHVLDVHGTIDFNGMDVDYIAGLPKLNRVGGQATYTAERFDIRITEGQRDAIKVLSGLVRLQDLHLPDSKALIDVDFMGPVNEILAVVDHKPLAYAQAMSIVPEQTKGESKVALSLSFPLKEDVTLDEVDVVCRASVVGAALQQTVGQKTVTMHDGSVAIQIADHRMRVLGQAQSFDHPWTIDATVDFTPGIAWPRQIILQGAVKLSKEMLPYWASNAVMGTLPLKIVSRFSDHKPSEHHITSTLAGTEIDMALLGWRKNKASTGNLEAVVTIAKDGPLTVKSMTVSWPRTTITASAVLDKALQSIGKIDVLSHAQDGDAHIMWSQTRTGPMLRVSAAHLDARQIWAHNEQNPLADDLTIDLHAQKILLTDDFSLPRVVLKATRKEGAWARAVIQAREIITQEKKPTHGEVTLLSLDFDRDRSSKPLKLTTTRAGDLLRLMEWTSQVQGGSLALDGHYQKGDFKGHAVLRDFFVDSKLPTMARTLNLISPTGLFEFFGREGLQVSTLACDIRTEGKTIFFRKGHAASGSLGISFAGSIDRITEKINLYGTVIPAYFINNLLGYIPIVGWITGGPGQGIVSASFSVKGTLDAPEVTSNPLSVLTPGIVKKILEKGDQEKDDDAPDSDEQMHQ